MERNVDIAEISDGRRYTENDMVRCGTNGCQGCSYCCEYMTDTILLDPLDMFHMTKVTGKNFEQLLEKEIELAVQNGLILPNLKKSGNTNACPFLNAQKRCDIHAFRPGFCRLFPLGRIYENGDFSYFLQVDECPMPNKTKVKVKKWISTPNLAENRVFINRWHDIQKSMIERLNNTEQEVIRKNLSLVFLKLFYMNPYDMDGDFYEQFESRWKDMKSILL